MTAMEGADENWVWREKRCGGGMPGLSMRDLAAAGTFQGPVSRRFATGGQHRLHIEGSEHGMPHCSSASCLLAASSASCLSCSPVALRRRRRELEEDEESEGLGGDEDSDNEALEFEQPQVP